MKGEVTAYSSALVGGRGSVHAIWSITALSGGRSD